MTVTLAQPAPSYVDERYVVLADPDHGTVVEVAPGSQLAVRFRRPLGASRWWLAAVPGHLLALPGAGQEHQFLVFGDPDETAPLRFERRRPDLAAALEVCELLVVPVSDAARTSRCASRRTA